MITEDILTEEAVRTRMEDITQEKLAFRQVFRDLDATGISNDEMKVPRPEDVMGTPEAVPEGAEFPQDSEEYEKVTINFEKWAQSVPITEEAQQDSMFDVAGDMVDRMGRQMQEFLNEQAFKVLSNNLNDGSPGGSSDQGGSGFDFHDVIDARQTLRAENFDPDTLIVNSRAGAGLLHSDELLRSTSMGDDTVRNGMIGRIAGLDVVESTANLMNQSSAGGYIVDSEFYGYEATRQPIQTNRHTDESRHTDFMQIYTRKGFEAMNPQAAIKVQP
jgi:HK97 family phage major capsid protein